MIVIASTNGLVGIEAAMNCLKEGGSALDAVEAGIRLVEAPEIVPTTIQCPKPVLNVKNQVTIRRVFNGLSNHKQGGFECCIGVFNFRFFIGKQIHHVILRK